MIVSELGDARGAGNLCAHLAQCGVQVVHQFQLIPGVAAGMTPEALKLFFSRFPNARVVADRRRQVPPLPFRPDDWKEVDGPGEQVVTSPRDPETSPLALAIMKAAEVQAKGIDGAGVRVCVIDTGIDFNHPDLMGTAILGADGMPLASDFTETDLTDTIGHGTAVAGCIASQGKQVYTITDEQSGRPVAYSRIKGVAPGVRLMSAKVFDARVPSGYDSAIIAALEWAAANGAHIVNMSLGGVSLPNDGSDPLAAAVAELQARGILVVVAAGNAGGGTGTLESPGCSTGALTAGASTMYRSFSQLGFLASPGKWGMDQLASFSSRGPAADGRIKPDMLAPGAFDWGLAPTNRSEEGHMFQLFGGTSQASPLLAGAAALVCQAYHKTNGRFPTPQECIRLLAATADDLGLPAHMQGAGRVNCLRAVEAVNAPKNLVLASPIRPMMVRPGQEAPLSLEIANMGSEPAKVGVRAVHFVAADDLSVMFNGRITTERSPQEIGFDVLAGTDLMQISLDWPSEDHSPQSARLLVAVYDPEGRFVNYQRPNGAGDIELGKSVDTWIARPQPGRWTARVVLRLGNQATDQAYTLAVRAFRRRPWEWLGAPDEPHMLTPGERRTLELKVAVPADARAGTYAGQLLIGESCHPFAVVVPVALEQGRSAFAGTFQHGYQGEWGNGDWLYHQLPIPAGTRSVIASVQWPDVDNSLECYLIDPSGHAVMGRTNHEDILDDGDTDVLGGQFMLANPEPGNWRIAVHSFAFCGRGVPEPYTGVVEAGADLVSPRVIQMRVAPGERAPLSVLVRNPGRMPITVEAMAQSTDARLVWRTLKGELKSGITTEGKAAGEGHITLGTVKVPFGTRQIGVIVGWDQPGTEVSLSLFDPVAQNDRATVSSADRQLMVVESHPVPGEWTIMAGVTTAAVENQTVQLSGAAFLLAPQELENVEAKPVTIQPGGSAIIPLTVRLPEKAAALTGRILVTTTNGDRLGEVGFLCEADDGSEAHSEAATTKE